MNTNNYISHPIIVVTGPESSGKSTLVNRLCTKYGLPKVEEFARRYLEQNGPEYTYHDLEKIALCQNIQERESHAKYPFIICDTDIITIDIWAMEKYKKSILQPIQFGTKKHYLLCKPDIPWEPDPLRENPNDRDRLFEIYESYLTDKNLSYEVLDKNGRKGFSLS